MLHKTCTTYKIGKDKPNKASQVKKDKSSQNMKVHAPSCREPNSLSTIAPRTKRFAYHYAENQTVGVPSYRTIRFAICCIGINTECGKAEGNAGSPINLD